MLKAGWDCFTPDAGTVDSINCPTCGHPMSVKRDCSGPRSSVEAMAIKANVEIPRSKHDFFQCENAEVEMHQQTRDLLGLSQDTPSPTLSDIYRGDAEDILQRANFSGWLSAKRRII